MVIYLVWAYDKVAKTEEVVDWDRYEKQATMKMDLWGNFGYVLRVSKHIVDKSNLNILRKTTFNVLTHMEADIAKTIKKANVEPDQVLLVKHHLNEKIQVAKQRYEECLDYIYDDEVEKHISAINAGLIE